MTNKVRMLLPIAVAVGIGAAAIPFLNDSPLEVTSNAASQAVLSETDTQPEAAAVQALKQATEAELAKTPELLGESEAPELPTINPNIEAETQALVAKADALLKQQDAASFPDVSPRTVATPGAEQEDRSARLDSLRQRLNQLRDSARTQ